MSEVPLYGTYKTVKALAFREKSLKPFELFPLASRAVSPSSERDAQCWYLGSKCTFRCKVMRRPRYIHLSLSCRFTEEELAGNLLLALTLGAVF